MEEVEQVTPQAPEAEQAVVGSVLVAPDLYLGLSESIDADDFFDQTLGVIWRAVGALVAAGSPVDKVSVSEYLRERDHLLLVGGPSRLSELLNSTPTSASASYYASLVREKSDARELYRLGQQVQSMAFDGAESAAVLSTIESAIDRVRSRKSAADVLALPEAIQEFLTCAPQMARMGLNVGIQSVTQMVRGLAKGEILVLGARTGMGKSAVCEQIAHRAACAGSKVLYVPTELGRKRTVKRMLQRASGLSTEDFLALPTASRLQIIMDFDGLPMQIMDSKARHSIESIWSYAERYKPDLIVIDHSRHLAGWLTASGSRDLGPNIILDKVVRMAQALDAAVLLAHQINREGAKHKDGRPRASDLRDSGMLEEAADKVILLHRPGSRSMDEDDTIEFIVEKSREGGVGTYYAAWDGPRMEVSDCTYEEAEAKRNRWRAKDEKDDD